MSLRGLRRRGQVAGPRRAEGDRSSNHRPPRWTARAGTALELRQHTCETGVFQQRMTSLAERRAMTTRRCALTVCRQRIQQVITGHRGRTGHPLYGIRRTLNTRAELLTDKQKVRLFKAFTSGGLTWWWKSLTAPTSDASPPTRPRAGGEARSHCASCCARSGPGYPRGSRSLHSCAGRWKRHLEFLAHFDVGASNGPRGHQPAPGTPARYRPGLPEPQALTLRSLIHSG